MALSTMSHKERVRRALFNELIDHIPTQLNYTAAFGHTIAAHLDMLLEQLPYDIGNHMLIVDINHDGRSREDGNVCFDWWGVGFDIRDEGYFAAINPLAESQNLDLYHWPDPLAADLLQDVEQTIAGKGDEFFIVPNIWFALFERAWSLRGFEQFFMAMVTEKDIQRDEEVPWTNYVRGVAAVLQASGYKLRGFDGLVHSTNPFGSGLSSSAAIEMATVYLFEALGRLKLDPVDMALIGQKAENEFVGVSTGILDQYSSVMGREGHAISLDCRHLTSDVVRINPDLPIVICNTRAERNLVGSDYDERRARCEEGARLFQRYYPGIRALRDVTPIMFSRKRQALPEPIAIRRQFIIEENKLALDLTRVLPEGRPKLVHSMFEASYRGARDLYEIISPAMDVMMNVMSTAPGAVASRQAGAGIGDRMVALVNDGILEPFTEHVINTYQQETEIQRKVYVVQTAPGAMILDWV